MNTKIIKQTPYGPAGIIWTGSSGEARIVRVMLSRPGQPGDERVSDLYPDSKPASCARIDEVAESIVRFLEGERIEFSLDVVDLSRCPEFQQSVLRAEHGIPRGRVSTYRLIARHLGRPKGARAVGNALANNPFPIIIPCHRAVRSDRHLGGYQGGVEMKRTLLEKEGMSFDASARVICRRFHYGRS